MDSTEIPQENWLQFNYTSINYTIDDYNIEKAIDILRPVILENVKNQENLAEFREHNTTFVTVFRDKNGILLYEFTYTNEDYK